MYLERVTIRTRIRQWLGLSNVSYSVADPALATVFQIGAPNYSGVTVTEQTALSLSAVYRAVALVAGTIGTLPLRTLTDDEHGRRRRISSMFDSPGGALGPTPMSWKETVVAHLMLHGNAYLRHIYGGAGQLIALEPIHPLCVSIEQPRFGDDYWPLGGKWFNLSLIDGTRLRLDSMDLTHIMGLSLDGIYGMSCIGAARNGIGTAIAGDRAAAKMYNNGFLIGGMVVPDEDMPEDEAKVIKLGLDANAAGYENAGGVPMVNRKLKFLPWQMSAKDAQFLESRAFQIEEIARWFGVPPHLLMQTDKQTSWGTGVEEQNNGLSRFTLNPWCVRIDEALSRLLPSTRWVEFDFAGLERPTPEDEINLLMLQTGGKPILTVNEARAIRNLPPIDGGDTLEDPAPEADPELAPADEPAPEAVPA